MRLNSSSIIFEDFEVKGQFCFRGIESAATLMKIEGYKLLSSRIAAQQESDGYRKINSFNNKSSVIEQQVGRLLYC
jgi:hypothetical protein